MTTRLIACRLEVVEIQGLSYYRKRAGFTQNELADMLGVTRAAVGMWEIGKSWPSAALLPQIADLLLCSIDELYVRPENYNETGDDEPCPEMTETCTADTAGLPA